MNSKEYFISAERTYNDGNSMDAYFDMKSAYKRLESEIEKAIFEMRHHYESDYDLSDKINAGSIIDNINYLEQKIIKKEEK